MSAFAHAPTTGQRDTEHMFGLLASALAVWNAETGHHPSDVAIPIRSHGVMTLDSYRVYSYNQLLLNARIMHDGGTATIPIPEQLMPLIDSHGWRQFIEDMSRACPKMFTLSGIVDDQLMYGLEHPSTKGPIRTQRDLTLRS